MPKVSVIMGVYNAGNEDMLNLSISSILNQSFGDFEFIICDDGSTDNTYNLLVNISRRDERIILIRNQVNKGLAVALNECIKIAKGEYIARQDVDDYSEKTRLQTQVSFLENNKKYTLVGSNINYFNDSGVWGKYTLPFNPKKKDFLFRVPFMHGSVMYRSSDMKMIGGYCTQKVARRCEDYELFMRIYARGYVGANIQESLYYFREDQKAHKRRKLRYRIDEIKVRYRGYQKLGLLPSGLIYIFKPVIVGFLPYWLLNILKDKLYKRKE